MVLKLISQLAEKFFSLTNSKFGLNACSFLGLSIEIKIYRRPICVT